MSGSIEKQAVIQNGVSPRAKAGAKRSEESLTETGGGGRDERARAHVRRLRPLRVSDSSLRSGRKASRNSVQNDGVFFPTLRERHPFPLGREFIQADCAFL